MVVLLSCGGRGNDRIFPHAHVALELGLVIVHCFVLCAVVLVHQCTWRHCIMWCKSVQLHVCTVMALAPLRFSMLHVVCG